MKENFYSFLVALFMAALVLSPIMLVLFDSRKYIKQAESMKRGDLYERIDNDCDNPFIPPTAPRVRIEETKKNRNGLIWILCRDVDTGKPYACSAKDFLSDYKLVENEQTEAVHQE